MENQIRMELLRAIVPQQQVLCLARHRTHPVNGSGKLSWQHRFVEPDEDAESILLDWNKHGDTNIYFAVAGYKSKTDRTRNNVSELKTLLLDIDIGKGDGFYATKRDALAGLKELHRAVPELPMPWVVDSGNGVHVYYELDRALPYDEWKPLAEAFAATVRKHVPMLMADPVRTRDACSVMRVPGSYNAKSAKSIPTKLLKAGKPVSVETLQQVLGSNIQPDADEEATLFSTPVPDYAKSKQGSNQFGGSPLSDLPLRPILAGCEQMKAVAASFGNVPEPEWVLALRVFTTVQDSNRVALKFSKGHPTFSARETLRKMAHCRQNFAAPSAACSEFEALHPERCEGCAHKGNVWTPSLIAAVQKTQEERTQQEQEHIEAVAEVVTAEEYEGYLPMPAYYRQESTISGEEITMIPVPNRQDPTFEKGMIKAHLMVKRGSIEIHDRYVRGKKEVLPRDLRVHLDIVTRGRKFPVVIPAVELSADRVETATKTLRDVGVMFTCENLAERAAVTKYLQHIVDVTAISKPRTYWPDKGWSETYPPGRKPLTLGAKRYLPDGTTETGVTKGDHTGEGGESFIEAFCSGHPVGTLADWQRGMEIYNRPDIPLTQMLLLSGVANMLLPIVSNQRGGILLCLSGQSGVGKTTLLRFMSSLIGDPNRCMVPGSSTPNALVNMLKQAQFFMLPVDDTLNVDATQLSLLLASVSSGMERMRLTTGGFSGAYTADWAAPFYSSLLITSNYSVESVIGTGGADRQQLQSDAARSRILEIPAAKIKQIGTNSGDWLLHEALIGENYGHAVDHLSKYLATNQRAVTQQANRMRAKLEQVLLSKTPRSVQGVARFWARYLACVGITGDILCNRLKILPWDSMEILKAGIAYVTGHHFSAEQDRFRTSNALWSTLTDNYEGRVRINYSYYTVTASPDWPAWDDMSPGAAQKRRFRMNWDTTAGGSVLMSALNIGPPPAAANVLAQKHKWRVIFTTVYDAEGNPLHIERQVLIDLHQLQSEVERHSRNLRVSGWEELYYTLVASRVEVHGVNPERPSTWGRIKEQVKARVDETPESKGEMTAVVRLTFPPLPGDVLTG